MIEFQQKFKDDAGELVRELEKILLALEENPRDSSHIENVFRAMHTLKGTSSMFGYDRISTFTHDLESIYDFIRDGRLEVNSDILNITFQSVDLIDKMLDDPYHEQKAVNDRLLELSQEIKAIINRIDISNPKTDHNVIIPKEQEHIGKLRTFYILFEPDANIEERGVNIRAIFDELEQLGTLKIIPVPNSDLMMNETSNKYFLSWIIFLSSDIFINDLDDVFIFAPYEVQTYLLSENNLFEKQEFHTKIQELALRPDTDKRFEFQELGLELDKTFVKKVLPVKDKETIKITEQKSTSIRVSSEKLDELMNLVSELITKQAELNLYAVKSKDLQLNAIGEGFQKLIRRLRNNALNIRLVPIENMLMQFKRLIRDLSAELEKEVLLVTEGAETELDKNILDSLANPLMHIIRNSIDHGIEKPEVRRSKGKPEKGIISIKASYSGSNVQIAVDDDGAGINLEKVKQKALEKGLITAETAMSDVLLLNLIVAPGFSTADNVSEVSGRGVGMDVVHKKISDLRGKLDIETRKDVGTKITLKLPQTLSIIDTLMVRVASNHFLIPLSVVDKCSSIKPSQREQSSSRHIDLDAELLPYIYMRNEFSLTGPLLKSEKVVIVKDEEHKIAIIVDAVVGEHQAVLKPLGNMFKGQEFLSGASLLGDGTLAFMIDTTKLIAQLHQY